MLFFIAQPLNIYLYLSLCSSSSTNHSAPLRPTLLPSFLLTLSTTPTICLSDDLSIFLSVSFSLSKSNQMRLYWHELSFPRSKSGCQKLESCDIKPHNNTNKINNMKQKKIKCCAHLHIPPLPHSFPPCAPTGQLLHSFGCGGGI